ncbi:alpha/beta fold hydrolase [Phreatobacter oligotrophus]|jgi:pimeloyl-ACP methyl ester carboxylesterase|uniref:alpha/beta fold hydrolase n=1 Tax=Phreatobacter oligotrophus TaxID=1122261 RepID=UPI002357D5FC|nr:alpha/beta hydrolase [Phreatobacter oligotrophus]MBX9990431.1 alpha/beta hydrolase [Phreatobacter oligotrophus]
MPIAASPDAPRGLPLVFVPGLNCTADLFAPQIAHFRDAHPVTVADHASDETIAEIAHRLLASAPPKFALIGLSMGGYVALEVMRQAPQRVAKLALLDTRASQDVLGDTEIRQAAIKMAQTGRFDDIHNVLWPRIVHIRRLGDTALEAIVRTMSDKTGPARFIRQQKAIMARPSYEASLAAIRCPTLILVGEDDALTPRFMSEDMAEAIRGSELVVVPDCGHLSTLERPEAVNAALERWLAA